MQATIIVTQQIDLSLIIEGGAGCTHHVQKKEFVSTITDNEITKLLLRGCSCENCKFLNSDSNQKGRPEKNVCTDWESVSKLKIKWIFYPTQIAQEEIIPVQLPWDQTK
jgi:hypothetical protein